MRLLLTISAFVSILFLSGCGSSYQLSSMPEDDVYYNPYAPEKSEVVTTADRSKSDEVTTSSDGYVETAPDSSKQVESYDDYYAYEYSSRIRRFHNDYYYNDYYHDYYTNRYWYNYDPFYYGTSIYVSTYPWSSWGHVYPPYGPSYNVWTGPWWYGNHSLFYNSFYAYSAFGYPYYGFYSNRYAGWYGGYYGGLYGGYYGGGFYSNPYDQNSNNYYARRDNHGAGSGLGQTVPARGRGYNDDGNDRKDSQRRSVAQSGVRQQQDKSGTRTDNTQRRGVAGQDRSDASQASNGRANDGNNTEGSAVSSRQGRIEAPARGNRATRDNDAAEATRSGRYARPSEREGTSYQKPVRYNSPNYAKPRSSREYSSPGSRRSYTTSDSRSRYSNKGNSRSRGSDYSNQRRKYVRPSDSNRGRSYNQGRSSRSSGNSVSRGSSGRSSSGVSRGSSSRRSSGSSIGRSSRSSGSSSVGRSSSGSSSRSSGSRSSGSSRRSGGGRN